MLKVCVCDFQYILYIVFQKDTGDMYNVVYLIEIYTEQNIRFQNFNIEVMTSLTTNQQLSQSLYFGVEFDCKLHQ